MSPSMLKTPSVTISARRYVPTVLLDGGLQGCRIIVLVGHDARARKTAPSMIEAWFSRSEKITSSLPTRAAIVPRLAVKPDWNVMTSSAPLNLARRCSSSTCRSSGAGDGAHRGRADAVFLRGFLRGLHQLRMVGQAEIVVGAEVEHIFAIHHAARRPAPSQSCGCGCTSPALSGRRFPVVSQSSLDMLFSCAMGFISRCVRFTSAFPCCSCIACTVSCASHQVRLRRLPASSPSSASAAMTFDCAPAFDDDRRGPERLSQEPGGFRFAQLFQDVGRSDSQDDLRLRLRFGAGPFPPLEGLDHGGGRARRRRAWRAVPASAPPSVPVRRPAVRDCGVTW